MFYSLFNATLSIVSIFSLSTPFIQEVFVIFDRVRYTRERFYQDLKNGKLLWNLKKTCHSTVSHPRLRGGLWTAKTWPKLLMWANNQPKYHENFLPLVNLTRRHYDRGGVSLGRGTLHPSCGRRRWLPWLRFLRIGRAALKPTLLRHIRLHSLRGLVHTSSIKPRLSSSAGQPPLGLFGVWESRIAFTFLFFFRFCLALEFGRHSASWFPRGLKDLIGQAWCIHVWK